MGIFNFTGQQEHRTFNYRPIYYDKDEEERRQVFGHVDGTFDKEKQAGKYIPGSYLKGSLRDGNYARRRGGDSKVQAVIGLVGIVLLVVIFFYFAKFFELL
ncbi:MAG: hypothetical protein J6O01_00975 [Bacteroidales bacterium]|jgi:hypothetical protein|nr:hypothetical protein [Bacteroidales bacterium]